MAERASLSETNVSALFEVLKTLRGLSSGSWGQKKNLRALFYCSFSWRIQISHLQQHLRTTVHHPRQILMPQPILIAPRGPHRFIPSGEGASPSPFGPLNARGCVHEPPCGGPPWPPLLPGPRKQKISVCVCACHTFFSEISRPCAPYIRLRLRVFLILTILIMVFHQRWS